MERQIAHTKDGNKAFDINGSYCTIKWKIVKMVEELILSGTSSIIVIILYNQLS